MSHIHKTYFSMGYKIESLPLKMASKWSDLPLFSFFPFVLGVNVEVGGYTYVLYSQNIY